jgi:hypothetical protein
MVTLLNEAIEFGSTDLCEKLRNSVKINFNAHKTAVSKKGVNKRSREDTADKEDVKKLRV